MLSATRSKKYVTIQASARATIGFSSPDGRLARVALAASRSDGLRQERIVHDVSGEAEASKTVNRENR